jgi:hypothetical protein
MSKLKRIHINQHVIRRNIKNTNPSEHEPVIGVETAGAPKEYFQRLKITGPCEIVVSINKPLSCGARVWIETQAEVVESE